MDKSIFYKRLIFVMLLVCLSICSFELFYTISKNDVSITTNALPITNKIVVLDAGHGKPDERCCTALTEQQKKKLI